MAGGDAGGPLLAAYFTVGLSSVSPASKDVSGKTRKRLGEHMFKRDGSLGCYVIGELCRSGDFSAERLPGSALPAECLGAIRNAQAVVGGRVVLVDSRESVFAKLYGPTGFRKLEMTQQATEDGAPLVTSFLVL